ncbi:MAG: DUF1801 domain-containing protein [Chitinophagales bacterium]
MAKYELKTKVSDASVEKFLQSVTDEEQRQDCLKLFALFKKITKHEPKLWGSSIIGFGTYHYKSKSGREGDWFPTGFAPRKENMTVYIIAGFEEQKQLLKKLGKFKLGKGCLYFRKLSDIDEAVLKDLIKSGLEVMKKRNTL